MSSNENVDRFNVPMPEEIRELNARMAEQNREIEKLQEKANQRLQQLKDTDPLQALDDECVMGLSLNEEGTICIWESMENEYGNAERVLLNKEQMARLILQLQQLQRGMNDEQD